MTIFRSVKLHFIGIETIQNIVPDNHSSNIKTMAKEIIDIPPLDSTISLNVSLDKFPQDLLKLHPMDIDINLKLDSSKVVGNNPLKPKKSSNSTVTMKIHSENVTITK